MYRRVRYQAVQRFLPEPGGTHAKILWGLDVEGTPTNTLLFHPPRLSVSVFWGSFIITVYGGEGLSKMLAGYGN